MKKYDAGDFPRRIEIELAASCNLRCSYCPRRYVDDLHGFMGFSFFKKLIDEVSAYPDTVLVLHRRGESLLHPDFIEICGYVKGKFKEVQMATNATLLDEPRSKAIIEAIDFISFSLDIPEVYNKTREPAKYDKVAAAILQFLKMNKGRVKTQVSMVKTLDTPPRNPEIFKNIWNGKVDRIRIYEEHSRNGKFGSLGAKRSGRVGCVMPFYEMLVFFDGKVGRCNHDWNSSPLGDANTSPIKEIWNCRSYKDLRRQHETMELIDEVCKGCDSWYPEIGNQGTGETVQNA